MAIDTTKIVQEYKKHLKAKIGDQLSDVLLYGSRSRGSSEPFSDIDVLCVLHSPFDYARMIRETSEITSRLSLEYDVVLSRVFVSEQDYRTSSLPFMMNVRKEAMPV